MVFSAVYQQGAGLHSGAALFKKPVKLLRNTFPKDSGNYNALDDIYSWIRDEWEHVIAHYIYAAGGTVLIGLMLGFFASFVYCFAYRNYSLTKGLTRTNEKVLYVVASIIYGLIIGGVALNFPSGSIVALILCLVYGFGIIGTYLYRKGGVKIFATWGTYPVLQYFFNAYVIGFCIVVGWMSVKGTKNLKEAGVI